MRNVQGKDVFMDSEREERVRRGEEEKEGSQI